MDTELARTFLSVGKALTIGWPSIEGLDRFQVDAAGRIIERPLVVRKPKEMASLVGANGASSEPDTNRPR